MRDEYGFIPAPGPIGLAASPYTPVVQSTPSASDTSEAGSTW
jgi:hypothetical protein